MTDPIESENSDPRVAGPRPVEPFPWRDGRLARRLADRLARDGWTADWTELGDGSWEARVDDPSLPGASVARGRSRVAAISRAHVEAVRRLDRLPGRRELPDRTAIR